VHIGGSFNIKDVLFSSRVGMDENGPFDEK